MSLTQQTAFYIVFNIGLISIISFSFATILKKHTNLTFFFSLPIGLLLFLGITYLLSYPFIFFKLSASLYQFILLLILILSFFYAIYVSTKEKYYAKISKTHVVLFSFALLFIIFSLFLAFNQSLAERSFDSAFYMTYVSNNVSIDFLGWRNYDSNILLDSININYDYSSFYYFNSFIIRVANSFFPSMNEITYGAQYVWQASFMLISLSILTCINIFKHFFKNRNYVIPILLISIFCLFYGVQYYNTALAFIGNNFRAVIIANIFFVLYQMYEENSYCNQSLIVTTLLFGSLISVSSSGFFISSFLLYGFFYALLKTQQLKAFKIIAAIGFPVFLYLFAYLFGVLTLIFTPMMIFLLIFLSKVSSEYKVNVIVKNFSILMKYVFPILFISISLFFHQQFHFKMDYFFFAGSSQDMVWDYFVFSNLSQSLINIILLSLLFFIVIKKKDNHHFVKNSLKIIIVTFLNPLVIPFTIKMFTNYVFYRSFDILFNPFTIIFALKLLFDFIPKKKEIIILLSLPFVWYSFNELSSFHKSSFAPPAYYNKVLKATTDEIEIHDVLNKIIVQDNIDYPIVTSQSYQTSGVIPHITMSYTTQTMRSNSIKNLTHDQAELYNIFAIYDRPEPDWTSASYVRVTEILDLNNVTFVIVLKDSSFYDEKTDTTYMLVDQVGLYYTLLYENDTYALFRNPAK